MFVVSTKYTTLQQQKKKKKNDATCNDELPEQDHHHYLSPLTQSEALSFITQSSDSRHLPETH